MIVSILESIPFWADTRVIECSPFIFVDTKRGFDHLRQVVDRDCALLFLAGVLGSASTNPFFNSASIEAIMTFANACMRN